MISMVIATLTELTVMVPLSTNCHRDEVLMTNPISLLSLSSEHSEGAALRYHPERSEGPLHVMVKRQTLEHDSLPLSLSVTSSPKSTHSDTGQFHL